MIVVAILGNDLLLQSKTIGANVIKTVAVWSQDTFDADFKATLWEYFAENRGFVCSDSR